MIEKLIMIEPLNWLELACACVAGVSIGFERQVLGKPAGMRTSTLICLSTYVFVAISKSYGNEVARIIGQVVTGVGFLGGGVIIAKEGMVQGMTSAACIWILAAVGATIGAGYPFTGVKIAILALIVLVGLDFFERSFSFLRKGVHKAIYQKKGLGE